MPIEGIEPAAPATEANAQPTPDAVAKNTGAEATGTSTPDAKGEAQPERTFTQADVDRIVTNRLKTAVKAEIKKLAGEGEGTPTVEELQRQLSETQTRASNYEAREAVRDYLADTNNKLNIRPENARAIEKLVMAEIQFEDGKPSNIKEAVNSVKSFAPALFVNSTSSINAGNGRTNAAAPGDMNSMIRTAAGL